MPKGRKTYDIISAKGIIDARKVQEQGIDRRNLGLLCDCGQLVRVARGLYASPNQEITQHHGLVIASKLVPKGVVCLLSALRFHTIGTGMPAAVSMALPARSWLPHIRDLPMEFHRVNAACYQAGIEHHTIEGCQVPIYSPAKTVADCFRFRADIGLERAIEALRETVAARKATIAQIHDMARICRVGNVILPYLEAIA